jgi:triosephosphate isomerase
MKSLNMVNRKVLIGGNWKCNPSTVSAAVALADALNAAPAFPENAQVVVAPTALHLGAVKERLRRPDLELAVQNVWKDAKSGAWTGELTVDMVRDFGVGWTILGHSERRSVVAAESPELVGAKVHIALTAGMSVIACVGEQLADRKAGATMSVVVSQLQPIVSAVPAGKWEQVVIAYEPVWAIGTGVVATPEQAQTTHAEIRAWLAATAGEEVASRVRIVYGGSVTAANCNELIKNSDIDGFLVGGASLKPEFLAIIQSAALKAKM